MAAPARQPDATVVAALPADYQPEQNQTPQLAQRFQRQLVDYPTSQPPGTIIVDTPNTYLYLIMGHGKALRCTASASAAKVLPGRGPSASAG